MEDQYLEVIMKLEQKWKMNFDNPEFDFLHEYCEKKILQGESQEKTFQLADAKLERMFETERNRYADEYKEKVGLQGI